MIITLFRRQ